MRRQKKGLGMHANKMFDEFLAAEPTNKAAKELATLLFKVHTGDFDKEFKSIAESELQSAA